jgi:hypothetical protein
MPALRMQRRKRRRLMAVFRRLCVSYSTRDNFNSFSVRLYEKWSK